MNLLKAKLTYELPRTKFGEEQFFYKTKKWVREY